jgi:hypothetical protein
LIHRPSSFTASPPGGAAQGKKTEIDRIMTMMKAVRDREPFSTVRGRSNQSICHL